MSSEDTTLPSRSRWSLAAWSIGGLFQALLITTWAYQNDDSLFPAFPLVLAGLTLVGWLAGNQARRFLPNRPWAALGGVLFLYLLGGVALGVAWDDEIFGIMWQIAAGPLGLYDNLADLPHGMPNVGVLGNLAIALVFLTIPTLLLVVASLILRNSLGTALTSLGVPLWLLLGIAGLLADIM